MPDRLRVLVTTGLAGTWLAEDDVLMLGPWCTAPSGSSPLPPPRTLTIAPFHWDDREKLRRDYDSLQELHDRLIDALTVSLNRYHGTAHLRRYWQILLDPWLMAYLGIVFDRWESLRLVFAAGERFETVLGVAHTESPPFAYTEFVERAISDVWNFDLLGRMIRFQYGRQCVCRDERSAARPDTQITVRGRTRQRTLAGRLAAWVDAIPAAPSARNRIVFFQAYFRIPALLRLSLAMRLVPRAYLKEFPAIESRADLGTSAGRIDRASLRLDLEPTNDFERYLFAHLPADVPTCAVEDHSVLATRASAIRLRPALIVTANAHWGHVLAKAWMAQRVEAGARLLILEHGGSFPARRELFDFEEDISDVRGTWFKPYHPKHVQVPPSKLVGWARRAVADARAGEAGCCLVVGNEAPKWVFRAHFYPMADQCRHSYRLTTEMIAGLPAPVAAAVRIRPASNWGWNLAERYREQFGAAALMQGGQLHEAFSKARVIVCTYPETTFSEAMASGRPAILLYPPEVYERHPVTEELLERMRRASIVFHDARQAAAHIGAMWANPHAWWNSRQVVAVREAFYETALRIRGDWLSEWAHALRYASNSTRAP